MPVSFFNPKKNPSLDASLQPLWTQGLFDIRPLNDENRKMREIIDFFS